MGVGVGKVVGNPTRGSPFSSKNYLAGESDGALSTAAPHPYRGSCPFGISTGLGIAMGAAPCCAPTPEVCSVCCWICFVLAGLGAAGRFSTEALPPTPNQRPPWGGSIEQSSPQGLLPSSSPLLAANLLLSLAPVPQALVQENTAPVSAVVAGRGAGRQVAAKPHCC